MAAANSTAVNNAYFSDHGQDLDTKVHCPKSNHNPFDNTWVCHFGNQKMLPPVSRLNNFFNIADKPVVPLFENHNEGDGGTDGDTAHLVPPNASMKLLHGIRKADDNRAQKHISLKNSRQTCMEMACLKYRTKQLEKQMERRIQEYQNREPDSQEVYYQKFLKLQYGSTNTPSDHSMSQLAPSGHSRPSLTGW